MVHSLLCGWHRVVVANRSAKVGHVISNVLNTRRCTFDYSQPATRPFDRFQMSTRRGGEGADRDREIHIARKKTVAVGHMDCV